MKKINASWVTGFNILNDEYTKKFSKKLKKMKITKDSGDEDLANGFIEFLELWCECHYLDIEICNPEYTTESVKASPEKRDVFFDGNSDGYWYWEGDLEKALRDQYAVFLLYGQF